MRNKQDTQGVRTVTELEQKYKLGKTFAEMFDLANDANNTAIKTAEELNKALTPIEMFNILTDNGALEGIYRGDDGEVYINASYIKSGELLADLIKAGVIRSKNGKISINLDGEDVVFDGGVTMDSLTVRSQAAKDVELLKITTSDNDGVTGLSVAARYASGSGQVMARVGELWGHVGGVYGAVGAIVELFAVTERVKTYIQLGENADEIPEAKYGVTNGFATVEMGVRDYNYGYISGLSAPEEDSHAANKAYVDALAARVEVLEAKLS